VAVSRMKGRGGVRAGAGRPLGSGGPPELVRRNRVVVMLSDAEFETMQAIAQEREVPVGTAAYEILARALKRRS
jgi:hypothetical protein